MNNVQNEIKQTSVKRVPLRHMNTNTVHNCLANEYEQTHTSIQVTITS